MSSKNKKKKPMSGGKKLLIAFGVVLAVILLVFGGIYLVFENFYSRLDYNTGLSDKELQDAIANYDPNDYLEPGEGEGTIGDGEDVPTVSLDSDQLQEEMSRPADMLSDKDVYNVLLIGVDSRREDLRGRSDTMLLLSINKQTKETTLTSFMRDIYVYIPDLGYSNRLNVPCAVGGPTLLVNTIEHTFGVEIHNYVMVNFAIFVQALDAFGGVDVTLTADEILVVNETTKDYCRQNGLENPIPLDPDSPGKVHLDGKQALAFSRIRKLGGDQARTERQRKVISAIMDKAKTMSVVELSNIAEQVLPLVATDLSRTDCLAMIVNAPQYLGYSLKSLRIPADDGYFLAMVDNMSVVKMDFDKARQLIKEEIYGVTE